MTLPVHQCSLFRNIEDIKKLSEFGVLFLLFEMGLELSLDRLKVGTWAGLLSQHTSLPLPSHLGQCRTWSQLQVLLSLLSMLLPYTQGAVFQA